MVWFKKLYLTKKNFNFNFHFFETQWLVFVYKSCAYFIKLRRDYVHANVVGAYVCVER